MNGPTSTGVDDRVNTGIAVNGTVTNPTLASVPAYDPRLVAVPLVDFAIAVRATSHDPSQNPRPAKQRRCLGFARPFDGRR